MKLLGNYAIYEPISTSPAQVVQLPPNNDPSFRIKGGSDVLIEALAKRLNEEQIILSEPINSISVENDRARVVGSKQTYRCKKVVSTLPPHLFVNSISVEPSLPKELIAIANTTHTWMGESIKIALSFDAPFWKEEGTSGTIFSNVGPIPEMYDHTNFEESKFALKGFLNSSYYSFSKEERLELILTQLEKYYGNQVRAYNSYEETVWKKEAFTSKEYKEHVLPHQNNACYL